MTNKTISHTPGPWQITATRNGIELSGYYRIGTGDYGVIADDIDNLDNANPIAAVPEMLEALQEVADLLWDLPPSTQQAAAIDIIEWVINKALGKAECGS
jgi:hypothetical protein